MDEYIDKLMAKLSREEIPLDVPKPPRYVPPKSFDEFLKAEMLDDWPQKLTSELPMGVDRKNVMGTQNDILQQLHEATPVDMEFIQNIENRLQNFEDRLNIYATRLIEKPVLAIESGDQTMDGTFMTDTSSMLANSLNISKNKGKKGLMESLEDSRRNTVEHCFFPGFHSGELPQLPGQLEAPQILHRVTKAQDFKPGFRTFWKKIYQSEASVAVLKDAFWWHLIDRFQNTPQLSSSKDRLFDRIADSFTALFASVNPEVKDKFFSVYSDCLAQSIFATFHEAFPESERHFRDDFKEYLVNNIYEWVAGFHPPPGTWKDWNVKRLEPRGSQTQDTQQTQLHQDLMASKNTRELKLDMDDFMRTVQKLGDGSANSALFTPYPAGGLGSREPSNVKSVSKAVQAVSSLPGRPNIPLSVSRQANCGTPTKPAHPSHGIQTGSNMERVMFNPKGQSPLIVHYLQMKQLKEKPRKPTAKSKAVVKVEEKKNQEEVEDGRKEEGKEKQKEEEKDNSKELQGKRLGRTQPLTDTRADDTTYKQLIQESRRHASQLYEEYNRICEATDNEMKKFEKQRRDLYRNINKIHQETAGPIRPATNTDKSTAERMTPLMVQRPTISITKDILEEEEENCTE